MKLHLKIPFLVGALHAGRVYGPAVFHVWKQERVMFNSFSLRAVVCVCCLFAGLATAADPPTPSQPYQKSLNTSVWNTSGPNATTSSASFFGPIWRIPADKILVVEHVSARVRV